MHCRWLITPVLAPSVRVGVTAQIDGQHSGGAWPSSERTGAGGPLGPPVTNVAVGYAFA